MAQDDLRSSARHRREYRVEYSVLSGTGALDVIPSRTLDISVEGARIETARPLSRGDSLSVRFEVPDLQAFSVDGDGRRRHKSTSMTCFGEVRWVNRRDAGGLFSAGIGFRGLSEGERLYLKNLLAWEMPETLETENTEVG